jgi:hypothetical protein
MRPQTISSFCSGIGTVPLMSAIQRSAAEAAGYSLPRFCSEFGTRLWIQPSAEHVTGVFQFQNKTSDPYCMLGIRRTFGWGRTQPAESLIIR